MPGLIKKMIDKIIDKSAKGNVVIKDKIISKFELKGINVTNYDEHHLDDPEIIKKVKKIAIEFNVNL